MGVGDSGGGGGDGGADVKAGCGAADVCHVFLEEEIDVCHLFWPDYT